MKSYVELDEMECGLLSGAIILLVKMARENVQLKSGDGMQTQILTSMLMLKIGPPKVGQLISKLEPTIDAAIKAAKEKSPDA